jgi:NADH dehydrogenase (ubiquinone) 1 alpha subcomplex subunit 12
MSTIGRTLKNLMKVGPASYMKQLDNICDTKWGRLVGTDVNGNKYFENLEEVSGKTTLTCQNEWLLNVYCRS